MPKKDHNEIDPITRELRIFFKSYSLDGDPLQDGIFRERVKTYLNEKEMKPEDLIPKVEEVRQKLKDEFAGIMGETRIVKGGNFSR
jgi:hypothetical protein